MGYPVESPLMRPYDLLHRVGLGTSGTDGSTSHLDARCGHQTTITCLMTGEVCPRAYLYIYIQICIYMYIYINIS